MPYTIIQRILRGFGANLYGQAVIIFIQLASVPILLHYWGLELYGEWLILFAIPAYLSITDLGFSQSAANDMSARAARGDIEGVLVVFQSLTLLVYSTVLSTMAVLSFVIMSLPLAAWLNITHLTATDAQWVLWFLAVGVLVQLPDGATHAGFRANGEYALHRGIHFTVMLLQHTALWLAAGMGHGPVVGAAAFAAVRCIATPAVALFLVRRHTSLKFGVRKARPRELAHLIRPAMANVAIPLAQAINIQGMVLVVGSVLGPASVVVLSTLRTLTRLAVRMVYSVGQALEPEMASAWGARDLNLLEKLYVRGMAASFWLAVAIALTLIFLGDWILSMWTHDQVRMDNILFYSLLLSAVASVLWFNGLNILKAANRHLRAAVWYVFSSLAAILLAVMLLKITDTLAYAGVALLVMDTLMAIYILVVARKIIDLSVPRLIIDFINPLPLVAAILSRKSNAR